MELTSEVNILYQKLLSELKKIGKFRIEEKKTSIHIANRAAFAGVHPRKNFFILNIVSSTPIISSRISKREQVSKSRFHNELKIESIENINTELMEWLKQGYELMG